MSPNHLIPIAVPFRIDYSDNIPESRTVVEHFHNAYELDFFIKADIEIFVKDMKYHITDGDVLFINAYDIHRVFYKTNQTYKRYIINFQPEFIHELTEVLQLEPILQSLKQRRNQKVNLDFKQRNKMEELLKHLVSIQTKISAYPEDITLEPELKMNLILILNDFYNIGLSQGQLAVTHFVGLKVKEAIHYMDKQYKVPIQLEDLAKLTGSSKYHLSHLFKKETHFTIIEYLQYRRVIEAQKLLVETDVPVIEVGMECGFQSLQHFYRVFKKIAKKSPLQYRRAVGFMSPYP